MSLPQLEIKFLADENLRRAVVIGVRRREPSISFLLAFDVGAAGKDDLAVLEIVAVGGRVFVSHDIRTMPRYFQGFIHQQSSLGLTSVIT